MRGDFMRIDIIDFISLGLMLAIVRTSQVLVIVAPKNGDTFKEGEAVKIVAEKSPGDPKFAFVYFSVSGELDNCPERISTHPRYECSFTIPPGSPRSIEIGVVAVTADKPVFSPDIIIYVDLPPSLILKELKSSTGNTIYQLAQNKKYI